MGTVQGQGVDSAGAEVRSCKTLDEFEECVRVQRVTWGEDLVVPAPLFVVALQTGGQALGAFERGRIVGFTLALAGIREGRPFLHSHMTAVLPEYWDRGVGRRLKLAQRDDALRRGIRLVEWTFDPLEIKNAHFNLVRLGAIVRRFIPNCYGITKSPLHADLPTDRLVAEWWLDSERVKKSLAGAAAPAGKDAVSIAVPVKIAELKRQDSAAAARVQLQVRERFERWFGADYVATGIRHAGESDNYILEPAGDLTWLRGAESSQD